MNPSSIGPVLRARWRFGLFVFLLVIGAALAISLLLPPRYKATASVLLDLRSPDPLIGTVLGPALLSGYMATQTDVVQSQRVARRVVEQLKLAEDPALRERWQEETQGRGSFTAWLADDLVRRLEVLPTRDSGVMTIGFNAGDPLSAAQGANAIVRAYIDSVLELRTEPARRYNDFFDERSQAARLALEKAQARLTSFVQSRGITASEEQLDVENRRLAELSAQLVALQGASADSVSRDRQASADPAAMREVFAQPAVASLEGEIQRAELRLAELRQRFTEAHPQVRDAQQLIAQMRSQLASETRRVAGGVRVDHRITAEREARLRALVDEQRQRVLRMKVERSEAAMLQQDVDSARQAYEATTQRARQTGLESQVNATNVSVLREATPPLQAVFPRLGMNLGVAALVGLLLALFAVALRERTDRRLRTVDDVVDGLRQPLLIELPRARVPRLPAPEPA
jgi:chain length determinant protein EpsF